MAATADKYSNNTLNDKDTVSGQTTTKNIFALMPLALTEYKANPSDQSESQATSDGSFCDKFFCHQVWHKKDTDNKEVVIGLLDPRPSASNNHYRKLHRGCDENRQDESLHSKKGKLHLVKNGIDYIVLNDGGLNTKALYEPVSVLLCTLDYVILTVSFRNAYWINTSEVILTIKAYHNGTRRHTYTKRLSTDMDMARGHNDGGQPYTLLVNPEWNQVVVGGDSVEVSMTSTNEEGDYTSSTITSQVSATERMMLIDLYKVTSLQGDPTLGEHYYGLLMKSWYNTLQNGDDDYPNLHDLFLIAKGTDWVDGRGNPMQTAISLIGQTSSAINENILTSYLPAGMYYGVPDKWDDPEEADPQGVARVVYVRSDGVTNGHAYRWDDAVIPTPTVTPEAQRIQASIGMTGDHTSWYSLENGVYTVVVFPYIEITQAKGNFSFKLDVTLRVKNGNAIESRTGITCNVRMGNALANRIIGIAEGAYNSVPEIDFTPTSLPLPGDILVVELEIYDVEWSEGTITPSQYVSGDYEDSKEVEELQDNTPI